MGLLSCLSNRLVSTQPDGQHVFIVPGKDASKDIVVALKYGADGDSIDYYLTDRSGNLRAAALFRPAGIHLIPNEQAVEKFKAELRFMAKVADTFPPTGNLPRTKP